MSVVVLASATASPGVTTLTLAMALGWPRGEDRRVRVLEADTDGGVLAARLGLRAEPNLAGLAVAGRRGLSAETLASHEQEVADGVNLIAAPASSEQLHVSLGVLSPNLVAVLGADTETDTLIDAGRLSPRSPLVDLARSAGLTLLVAVARRDQVEIVAARAAALREVGCAVGLVCAQARSPHLPAEFAEVAGVELVGVVGADGKAAAALCGESVLSDRLLARSVLVRHATDLAYAVAERLRPRLTPDAGGALLAAGREQ